MFGLLAVSTRAWGGVEAALMTGAWALQAAALLAHPGMWHGTRRRVPMRFPHTATGRRTRAGLKVQTQSSPGHILRAHLAPAQGSCTSRPPTVRCFHTLSRPRREAGV
ncbi:MAG: hypothetical protein J3K34DRAFT_402488 [Monoraphidium minutum]|nr:MAG: hypothetical protein J3K34DRAFT_402488 [Monoraphidium minutum]